MPQLLHLTFKQTNGDVSLHIATLAPVKLFEGTKYEGYKMRGANQMQNRSHFYEYALEHISGARRSPLRLY